MAKRILVPVDFSEFSPLALARALEHATESTEILLLHVYEPPHLGRPDHTMWVKVAGEMMPLADLVKSEAKEKLDALVEEYTPQTQAKIVPRLLEGRAAATIAETAQMEGCDMIVLATHGRSGFKRLVLGSVAEAVVRRAECPVLTVPPPNA